MSKRRVTVADHQRFRATGQHPHEDDADLVEIAPEILDRPTRCRPASETRRVLDLLDLLDELDREGETR